MRDQDETEEPTNIKIIANSSENNGSKETKEEKEATTLITEEPKEIRKLWVDFLDDNRNSAKGKVMEFIAPKIVNREIEVEIKEEDIEVEVKFWDTSLIMYVLGGDLSMNTVNQHMKLFPIARHVLP